MLSEDTKILEFNQYQKSDKSTFIIYADMLDIMKYIMEIRYNGKDSEKITTSTTKVSEHIPSDFPMSTISSFRSKK